MARTVLKDSVSMAARRVAVGGATALGSMAGQALGEVATGQPVSVPELALTGAAGFGLGAAFPGEASGCGCFPAQTQVDTPHGKQAIVSLKVGDQVEAESLTTGKVEAEPVLWR